MIDVSKHIQALLNIHNSIIVPNLGEFSTRSINAYVTENEDTIYPPAKIVEFNDKIKVDDGMLISSIALSENLPTSIVESEVSRYVADIQSKLSQSLEVNIPNICDLYKDSLGNVLLVRRETTAVENPNFGFEPVKLSTLNDDLATTLISNTNTDYTKNNSFEDEEIPAIAKQESDTKKSTISEILAENAKNKETSSASAGYIVEPFVSKIQEPPKKSSSSFWMWLLPLLIIGLIIALLWQLLTNMGGKKTNQTANTENYQPATIVAENTTEATTINIDSTKLKGTTEKATPPNTKNNTEASTTTNTTTTTSTQSEINKSETPTASATDSKTTATTTKPADKPIEKATTSKTNTNNTSKTTAATSGNLTTKTSSGNAKDIKITASKENEYVNSGSPKGFYIIVGSFKDKTNAEKLVKKINGDKLNGQILAKTDGNFRAAVYVSKNEADIANTLSKSTVYNKDAWVLDYK